MKKMGADMAAAALLDTNCVVDGGGTDGTKKILVLSVTESGSKLYQHATRIKYIKHSSGTVSLPCCVSIL